MLIRMFDLLFSCLALLVLSPVLVPVYVALKLTGDRQAFYVQMRVGRQGKEFGLLKFVTMVPGAEHLTGGYLTQKDDPRILPLGKFLRKTKINELPQIINIFLGHMSFVGPRPLPRVHYDLYGQAVRASISAVRPGLTGIGSVVFRDEEDILNALDVDRGYFHANVIVPYKGHLELWYCRKSCLGLYFLLLLLTAWAIVQPRTIVWLRLFRDLPEVPVALRSPLGIERAASAAAV